jgi:hypothetical protein
MCQVWVWEGDSQHAVMYANSPGLELRGCLPQDRDIQPRSEWGILGGQRLTFQTGRIGRQGVGGDPKCQPDICRDRNLEKSTWSPRGCVIDDTMGDSYFGFPVGQLKQT